MTLDSIRLRPRAGIRFWCILAACAVLLGCPPEPPVPEPPPEPPPPPPPATCDANRNAAKALPGVERGMPDAKIVGGFDAPIDKFPFAAAIVAPQRDGSLFQFCGGSLIAPDWVLTAAHCQVSTDDQVVLGREDLRTDEGTVHDIQFVLIHSGYTSASTGNDISLVKLATASTQAPAALIDAADTNAQPGDDSTVIGWGRLSEGGSASDILQEVTIPIVSNPDCDAAYSGISILDSMVCAGLEQGTKDSCQGDSGGPLMVQGAAGDWRQNGVVSFGIGCARPEKYGVYTRLSKFVDWVDACKANPPS